MVIFTTDYAEMSTFLLTTTNFDGNLDLYDFSNHNSIVFGGLL